MTDDTINLDTHRGMKAQKETRLRRLHAEVREQRDALRVPAVRRQQLGDVRARDAFGDPADEKANLAGMLFHPRAVHGRPSGVLGTRAGSMSGSVRLPRRKGQTERVTTSS